METLRRDLHQWTRKFRCAATVKHGVVVANMQYGLAEEERTAAKAELLDIIKYNFRGAGDARFSLESGPFRSKTRPKTTPKGQCVVIFGCIAASGGPTAASSRAKLAPVPEEQRQKFKLVPHTLRVTWHGSDS